VVRGEPDVLRRVVGEDERPVLAFERPRGHGDLLGLVPLDLDVEALEAVGAWDAVAADSPSV